MYEVEIEKTKAKKRGNPSLSTFLFPLINVFPDFASDFIAPFFASAIRLCERVNQPLAYLY